MNWVVDYLDQLWKAFFARDILEELPKKVYATGSIKAIMCVPKKLDGLASDKKIKKITKKDVMESLSTVKKR